MPDGTAPSIDPAKAGPTQTLDPSPTPNGLKGLLSVFQKFKPSKETGLNGVLETAAANGAELTPAERVMMERILVFDKKRVEDVAIPRADIVGVAADVDLPDLLKTFSEANHSRLPVYRGDLDDPIGMVHIKDVVGLLADPSASSDDGQAAPILDGMIRKLLYVPPSMPVTDLLLRMQASRVHMALVIDEFGGTDGLVTIEDLIELIVGEIRDEHDDEDDFTIRKLSDGKWDADARTPLEDIVAQTGLAVESEDHDADTLGGLVFSLAGRVPLRGEIISHPNGPQFEICDADPRRIRRVVVRAKAKHKDAENG